MLVFGAEELESGGGVVVGVSCAIAGNVSAIARKTAQYPQRAISAYLVDRLFDVTGIGAVRCGDETWGIDTGTTNCDGHSGGIKLS